MPGYHLTVRNVSAMGSSASSLYTLFYGEPAADIMYDIPSRNDIDKVTITEDTINGGAPVLTIRDITKPEQSKEKAS